MMNAAKRMPHMRGLAIILLSVAMFGLALNAKLSLYHQERPALNCSTVKLSVEDRFSKEISPKLQALAVSGSITARCKYFAPPLLLLKVSSSRRNCKRGLLRATFAQNHCPTLHFKPFCDSCSSKVRLDSARIWPVLKMKSTRDSPTQKKLDKAFPIGLRRIQQSRRLLLHERYYFQTIWTE